MDRLIEFTKVAELNQGYYLSDERIGGSLQSLIFYESSAERSIIYEPQVIHGLMQTPDYARTLIFTGNQGFTDEVLEGAVHTRMERRRILSLPNAARFTFYLHETALRLRVGADETMHEQLLHIVLTAALDNVSLRIVPSAAGERSVVSGAFHLMEFDGHRPVVYLDHLGGSGLILDDSSHVRSYRELTPTLDDIALDEGQSRKFAADLADEYDRGSQRGVADNLAQEQLQRRIGIELRGSGVVESTAIYE
ncbi:DUF5753 domain-containing protein [Actinophytocola sediminis]